MKQRGSDPDNVRHQLACFEQGFDYARLDRAATLNDGIVSWDEETVEELASDYPHAIEGCKVMKFVPASGAASRMFKSLYDYLEAKDAPTVAKATEFLHQLDQYPFYEALVEVLRRDGYDWKQLQQNNDYKCVIRYLLDPIGLNYGSQAKGLLPFHRYGELVRTALEEHLVEAALYAQNQGQCNLHVTVSPQHWIGFEALLREVTPAYGQRFHVKYHAELSIQDSATDTVAAELDNSPFRDEEGQLLFRPAGHGALIYNLNKLDADLVFVKNIDNVVSEDQVETIAIYKKALAMLLLQRQNQTFQYLRLLEKGEVDEMMFCEMLDFAESELMIEMEDNITKESLFAKFNRPIRVCGMVKNEGEPGGGPFWVFSPDGTTSLQIVESSQINKEDPDQLAIMKNATHFNPVDLVCGLKNYKGQKFDLLQYVDPNTGFISSKSYGSRTLKALELPGLWNGAMSDWITIFVEVPVQTFHPVKTVFDLARK